MYPHMKVIKIIFIALLISWVLLNPLSGGVREGECIKAYHPNNLQEIKAVDANGGS